MHRTTTGFIFVWIVPTTLFILCLLFRKDIEAFYLSWLDPVYAYLFNGLNLARGEMSIGHTDHPGTPLQVLCAVVIRIVYSFRDANSISTDVLTYPEIFLSAISYTLIAANVAVVGFTGHLVYRKTLSIGTAMFIQLSPLVSIITIKSLPIPSCESLLLVCEVLLIALLYIYTFTEITKPNRYVFLFALLAACCVATKVSAAPVFLVPLIVLQNNANRIRYLLLTLLFFIVFVLPAISDLDENLYFLRKILIHTGKYGSGTEEVINFAMFFDHLKRMFTEELPFTLICILYVIFFIHRAIAPMLIDKKLQRLVFALAIATLAQIIIVAKHYSFHYMIPVFSFTILGFYALLSIYAEWFKTHFNMKFFSHMRYEIVAVFLLFIVLTIRLIYNYNFYPNLNHPMNKTVTLIEKRENPPHIICSKIGEASSYKEAALYFGLGYSGAQHTFYCNLLKQIYPDTYFYSVTKNELYDWQTTFMKSELISKYDSIWLYIKQIGKGDSINYLSLFKTNFTTDSIITCSNVYSNEQTSEEIYNCTADSNKLQSVGDVLLSIACDMEQVSGDSKFYSTDSCYQFENGILQNNKKWRSGKYSVCLRESAPYALKIKLTLPPGAFVKASVWRHSTDGKGRIVASSDAGFYEARNAITNSDDNGWELIENNFAIPVECSNDDFYIYLWYNGKQQAYFDDLTIRIIGNN